MVSIPSDFKYTKTHEWVRHEDGGIITLGLTHHAQESLGDIVFVEFPENNEMFSCGDEICVIESSKAAAEVYSPVTGRVIECNHIVSDDPGIVNKDPYGKGWLLRIKINNDSEIYNLLDSEEYNNIISEV